MMNCQMDRRKETIVLACFAGVFLTFIFFYATTPIADPDFWWHLKSGEVMVQKGTLLHSDPFTYMSDEVVSARESLILKGYWLWEITAYGLYSLLGFNGIFLLNFLTVGAMAGVAVQQMRRQEVGYTLAVVLLTLGFSLLRGVYLLERPQVVSFLLAAILIALLVHVRDGGRLGWTLPLLMGLWANIHGGFVVGDFILLCFAVGAIIEYRHDLPRLRHLLLWIVLGIGASLLNPNGVLAFGEIFAFHSSALMAEVSEYQRSWVYFQKGFWSVGILWLLIALYGAGIWLTRRFYWPELFVALFLAYFSVSYLRNIGFFAVAMLPSIGFYLQQGGKLRSWHFPSPIKYLMVFIAAALLLWQAKELLDKGRKEGIESAFYPAKSSQFILSSGLVGRMLNSYNFGGYQIWKFYPQHRVFIDGRGLDIDIYRDWKLMASASLKEDGGRKEFEVLLDRYDIDYVVQPHIFHDSGRLTPLLKFLMVKPEWIPIYVDHQCFILVRKSQKNAAVIEHYQMDKRDFNGRVTGALTALCKTWPKEVINHVALAEMLIFIGRYAEAESQLTLIAGMQPDNFNLPVLRNQLDVLKNGRKQ